MNPLIAILIAVAPAPAHPVVKPSIQYVLRVDSADLSGWSVTMYLRSRGEPIRLAMAAHPEYDDRYWRYVRDVTVDPPNATVERVDSAVWQVDAPRGMVTLRYRLALPAPERPSRAAWKPFLTPSGGLIGGPHSFMYVLGAEDSTVLVSLVLPASWQIATEFEPVGGAGHGFRAANAAVLMESPILVGHLREWRFIESGIRHRVVYWPLPDAAPFDTTAFVAGVQAVVHQAIALFGGAPYREYTFLLQDGAYGALEHQNSVTLGAPSRELATDPQAALPEIAHEFVHAWNLMTLRPAEYRDIDYDTQSPVSCLWFSEGFTMYYADLLLRRAGMVLRDTTRLMHVQRLIASYLFNPAYARFSAEQVSDVAYNSEPGALGDYAPSTHLQGELIGTMLDLVIRDATHGQRSLDDVMRLLYRNAATERIDGPTIERAVERVCGCDVTPFFDAHIRGAGAIDFDRYLGLIGLKTSVTWGPAMLNGAPDRDLRIFGYRPDGERGVRLIITNPGSSWGRAGLHSRDRLVSIDGMVIDSTQALRAKLQSVRMGDTVRVSVQRPAGVYTATVVVTGFDRPTVRVEGTPTAVGTAWLNAKP